MAGPGVYDPHEKCEEKRRTALVAVVLQLILSVIGFSVSLRAYVYSSNIQAGSFWSQVGVFLGALFLLVGVCLRRDGKAWMVAGFIFNSISILLTFIATIVDAVQAGHISNTDFSGCRHADKAGAVYCSPNSVVSSPLDLTCKLSYAADTCYCCHLYRNHHCGIHFSLSTQPSKYEGVSSCDEVEQALQSLLWASMAFNLLAFLLTIISVGVVSAYKTAVCHVHPVSPGIVLSQNSINTSMMPSGMVIYQQQQQAVGFYPQPIRPPAYGEHTRSSRHPPPLECSAPPPPGYIPPYEYSPPPDERPPPYAP